MNETIGKPWVWTQQNSTLISHDIKKAHNCLLQSELSRKKNTNTIYQCIYMEFRKMVTMTLLVRQQKRYRCKEQTFGLCGRRRGWDDLRE